MKSTYLPRTLALSALLLSTLIYQPSTSFAQGTAFTYNGRLNNNGTPVTGAYDLRFTLYDANAAGNVVAGPLLKGPVGVTNGLFTVALDFGAGIFTGPARWLNIEVQPAGGGGFTALTPRQEVTSSPYAIRAQTAGTAASVATGTVTADQLNTGGVPPTPGQFLSYAGGNFLWSDPGVAAGNIWSALNNNAYYTAGNVGIGIPNPQERLTIAGVSSFNNGLKVTGNTSGGTGIAIENTSNGGHKYDFISGGVGNGIGVGAFGIWDETAGSYRLAIDATGNVGIGTTSPGERLTVGGGSLADTKLEINAGGDTYAALRIKNSAGSWNWQVTPANDLPGGRLRLTDETTGNEWLSINHNGDLFFANRTRQLFNMFGTGFGIGVQTANLYSRSGAGFAWHIGGAHNDATYNSGGGTTVATLDLTTGLDFGSRLGQHLSLWGGTGARRFAIGIQAATIYSRTGNGAGDAFAWYKGGIHDGNARNPGGGQTLMTLDGETGLFVAGPASVSTLTIRGGADLAEPFQMSHDEISKGSVVVIDKEHPGRLKLSVQAYDKRVAGIISGANGVNPGISLHQEGTLDGGQNVALSGRVYVQADTASGEIEPGDLLTTSDTPGHAMKATDSTKAQGAILGKAMSPLKQGKGMVLVLVTLQ